MVSSEIWLDIGAGKPEDAISAARRFPEVMHIALDPTYQEEANIPGQPSNLTFRRWGFSQTSPLPFGSESVDKVRIFFLMGELRETGWEQAEARRWWRPELAYEKLIEDVKQVLKLDGTLQVVEPKENIQIAEEILSDQGFFVHSIKPLGPDHDTATANMFRAKGIPVMELTALRS